MESSLEVSRGILLGIIDWVNQHDPWALDFIPGGIADQRIPLHWNGDGIIARVASRREGLRLVEHPAPKVIFDPQAQFLDPAHPLAACCRVEVDHAACGRAAADYFLARGFSSFAYLGATISSAVQIRYDSSFPAEPNWSSERREGYTGRLAEKGFPCAVYPLSAQRQISENWCLEKQRVADWLSGLPKPVAVFTPNDARGRQVTDACLTAGLPVPYRVAVLGVNNDETLCRTSFPPLSSIPLDARRAGYQAAALLDLLIQRKPVSSLRNLYNPLPIVTRDSTEQTQTDDRLVIAAMEFIRQKRGFGIRTPDVAAEVGFSVRGLEYHFQRAFKRSIGSFIREVCFQNIRTLVTTTEKPFGEIAAVSGQLSSSHVASQFRAVFGCSMTECRVRARGSEPRSAPLDRFTGIATAGNP